MRGRRLQRVHLIYNFALGFGVLGFGVQGLGLRVKGSGLKEKGLGGLLGYYC